MIGISVLLGLAVHLLDGNPPYTFQWCMDGPGQPCQRGCEGYDFDDDLDVDLYDWAEYTLEWEEQ